MKPSLLSITAAALLLTGCAAPVTWEPEPGKFVRDLPETPADRIDGFTEELPGTALVEVFNMAGENKCNMSFLIDGKRAIRQGPGERTVLHVPAGEHTFSVTHDWDGLALCSVSEDRARGEAKSVTFAVEAGRTYQVHLQKGGWNRFLGEGILDKVLLQSYTTNIAFSIEWAEGTDRLGVITDPAPMYRETAAKYMQKEENTAEIKVKYFLDRDRCAYTFFIDHERVADFLLGNVGHFHVPAGKHTLSVTFNWETGMSGMVCAKTERRAMTFEKRVDIDAKASETYLVRLESVPHGRVPFTRPVAGIALDTPGKD